MKTKIIYLASLGLMLNTLTAQTTVTLQALKDAAIGFHDGANTAGNNYGGAQQNAAFCIPSAAQNTGFNVNRALIDFNLTVLPAGAVLVSAELNLYALSPIGSWPGHTGTANAATLQRITQGWQEYTATWNNQPATTVQNQVSVSQSTATAQNYTIDVTPLVQDMLSNPQASFGFKLQLVNEANTNILGFCSKDHSNAALRPTLTVKYKLCTGSLQLTAAASSMAICPGESAVLTASGAGSYTWTMGQQVIGHTSTISVGTPGSYTVNGTDDAGCSGQAVINISSRTCTGIDAAAGGKKEISIFTNPASGAFTISSDGLLFDQVRLSDIQGRLIMAGRLHQAQDHYELSGADVAPGLYLCTVMNGNTVLLVKKIVVTAK